MARSIYQRWDNLFGDEPEQQPQEHMGYPGDESTDWLGYMLEGSRKHRTQQPTQQPYGMYQSSSGNTSNPLGDMLRMYSTRMQERRAAANAEALEREKAETSSRPRQPAEPGEGYVAPTSTEPQADLDQSTAGGSRYYDPETGEISPQGERYPTSPYHTPLAALSQGGPKVSPSVIYDRFELRGPEITEVIGPIEAQLPDQGAVDLSFSPHKPGEGPVRYINLANKYAESSNVPLDVVLAIIEIESEGVPDALGKPKYEGAPRAQGLMQVMPFWFPHYKTEVGPLPSEDSLDPETNIKVGTWILAKIFASLQDWDHTAAAYFNAYDWRTKQITGVTDINEVDGFEYVRRFRAARRMYQEKLEGLWGGS